MTATGILFSNLHDSHLPELTAVRTMASVPFGCRYRFIDFPLSSMVNTGITDVNIITHYNYRSLMDHIGTGKDWDLARRTGGLTLLPPYVAAYNGIQMGYNTHLDALKSISDTIQRLTSDVVVLCDCDAVYNIDLKDMIAYHLENDADVTAAVKTIDFEKEDSEYYNLISSNENGDITDIVNHPKDFCGKADISINIWIIRRTYLQKVVLDAVAHGYSSFTRDIVMRRLGRDRFKTYEYSGFYACVNTICDYFRISMSMLNEENRRALFNEKTGKIYTKVRNSPPTLHTEDACVTNSLIADGCIIDGTVENSILFRGVRVGKGAVVKNCILFQDTQISQGSFVNCVIADKNVVIRSDIILSGHPTMPICIAKGKMI